MAALVSSQDDSIAKMFTGFFVKFMDWYYKVLKKINIFANGTPKIRK
jgi:hypothetical protein